ARGHPLARSPGDDDRARRRRSLERRAPARRLPAIPLPSIRPLRRLPGAGPFEMTDRFSFPRAELRRRTVRGAIVTGGFLVLIDGLVLIQGLIVTRLLGPKEIGLYGIVSTTVITLIALKRVGVDELFVQQEEADQEKEFQYAFTIEVGLSVLMALIIL